MILVEPPAAAAPPGLAVFFGAAVAGLAVLLVTLGLGRSVESGGRKALLFLVGLVLATATAVAILVFVGGLDLGVFWEAA